MDELAGSGIDTGTVCVTPPLIQQKQANVVDTSSEYLIQSILERKDRNMEIQGNGSSINSTPESTEIKGPSGSVKTGEGGVKAGDELTPELAQKIAEASNGQLKVEDGHLVGPDGLKLKIGEPLKEEDIQALSKFAPDAIKGKKEEGGAEGGKGESSGPAEGKPSPAPAGPSAAPEPMNSPSDAIKAGDMLTPDMAQKIAADSNGKLKVEGDSLVGPDGLKLKIGEKLSEQDIQALAKHAPEAVNGGGNVPDSAAPGGAPSSIPAPQSDSPPPVPA